MLVKITIVNDDGLEIPLQMGKSYDITTFEKTYDREIRHFYRGAMLKSVEGSLLRFYCSDSREPYPRILVENIESVEQVGE